MNDIEIQDLIKNIKKINCVTYDIRDKYFKDMNYKDIRDWLEKHGIDRHITIDLISAGVIFIVKSKANNKKVLL